MSIVSFPEGNGLSRDDDSLIMLLMISCELKGASFGVKQNRACFLGMTWVRGTNPLAILRMPMSYEKRYSISRRKTCVRKGCFRNPGPVHR